MLVNLGSGSIGVVLTLVLTGWWSWRDRREARTAIELQEINNYLDRTNELSRVLAIDIEFSDELSNRSEHTDETVVAHHFLRFIQQTEQSYVRLASTVKDEYVLRQASRCIYVVGRFETLIRRGEGTNEERAVQLNEFSKLVTKTYGTCNRKISKHIVAKYGPDWA